VDGTASIASLSSDSVQVRSRQLAIWMYSKHAVYSIRVNLCCPIYQTPFGPGNMICMLLRSTHGI
jgi:hypothetical protein